MGRSVISVDPTLTLTSLLRRAQRFFPEYMQQNTLQEYVLNRPEGWCWAMEKPTVRSLTVATSYGFLSPVCPSREEMVPEEMGRKWFQVTFLSTFALRNSAW